jgi:hypothetical protein
VLWPEWLEPEVVRHESDRNDESERDERPFPHTFIFHDPAVRLRR